MRHDNNSDTYSVDKPLHKKSKKEPTESEVDKNQHHKSNTILSSSLHIPSHNLSQKSTALTGTSGVSVSKTTSTTTTTTTIQNEHEHNQESEYNNFGLEEFYGDNTMDQFSLLHGPEEFSML